MKLLLTILITAVTSLSAMAQKDTLKAGVYNWSNVKVVKSGGAEKRQVINGKTGDLKVFDIYTLTLPAGKNYDLPVAENKFEKLIIVKSGNVTLTLNDSSKTIGYGSLALVLPGDQISFKNTSGAPATWYVINFESADPVNNKRGRDAGASFIKDWNSLKISKTEKGESRNVFNRPTAMFNLFDAHATALNSGYASHPPHVHRQEELILMLTGSVQEHIGAGEFMANAGDCIYLSSGILHGPKNINSQQTYYYAIQWHRL
ncbi:cupin domain-containing protein [Mucilaginibacter sp. dw_454]|uniref:cupin domain-containing protein n=1 Tax=Mucilaginibacter sp. dw_454 TaxID=2720079 RepID=UPI001BD46DAA|nr:cupin domain-containing protein [Mucilaginibacter sp. dw_454]